MYLVYNHDDKNPYIYVTVAKNEDNIICTPLILNPLFH